VIVPDTDDGEDGDEFVTTVGSMRVDWPRALGYYGALGVAVAFDVIAPPLGLFIAAVPLLKFLKRKHASRAERWIGAVMEGAGKPVGGDAEGVVRPKWIDEKTKRDEAAEHAALERASAPEERRASPAPAA
jgi:hypothetical protein